MAKSNGTEARVQVAVRARPLNQREVRHPHEFERIGTVLSSRSSSSLLLSSPFMARKYSSTNRRTSKRCHELASSQHVVPRSHFNRHHAPKAFSYDFCFDSTRMDNSNYASASLVIRFRQPSDSRLLVGQELIFERLGVDIVKTAFEGYNACIFAYGQTGERRERWT